MEFADNKLSKLSIDFLVNYPIASSPIGANIGGITGDDIVVFLFRIIFGDRFKNIYNIRRVSSKRYGDEKGNEDGSSGNSTKNIATDDDIIKACLCAACGPAFSHVTKNKSKKGVFINAKGVDYEKLFDSNPNIYKIFEEFCNAMTSNDKANVIVSNISWLNSILGIVKCYTRFGHYQKLFNVALKLYICVYAFRAVLKISNPMCTKITRSALDVADCPIDSKIRDVLVNRYGFSGFSKIVWSRMSPKEYLDMQDAIRNIRSGSNLLFDFKEWH